MKPQAKKNIQKLMGIKPMTASQKASVKKLMTPKKSTTKKGGKYA